LKNRRSIELAVRSILATQGIDPEKAFERSSVLELIRVAGGKLNFKVSEESWTMVSSWQTSTKNEERIEERKVS